MDAYRPLAMPTAPWPLCRSSNPCDRPHLSSATDPASQPLTLRGS